MKQYKITVELDRCIGTVEIEGFTPEIADEFNRRLADEIIKAAEAREEAVA